MPLQHQRIYIIRRIFQTVLVQHPRAFCQAHTCQTVILRHNQVPGLHPVDECKIHTVSAFVKYQRLCPFPLDTMGCIAQNHNWHTFFPALLRVKSTTGQPSASIKIVMCLFSFPHRTVLWFDNCTMFPLCFSTRRRHSFSAHRKKRGRLFRKPPEKPPVSYYSKSAALFLQLGLHLGQHLFAQIVDKFGTDELQHLPHPLGKLHRSFPRICRSAKAVYAAGKARPQHPDAGGPLRAGKSSAGRRQPR